MAKQLILDSEMIKKNKAGETVMDLSDFMECFFQSIDMESITDNDINKMMNEYLGCIDDVPTLAKFALMALKNLERSVRDEGMDPVYYMAFRAGKAAIKSLSDTSRF